MSGIYSSISRAWLKPLFHSLCFASFVSSIGVVSSEDNEILVSGSGVSIFIRIKALIALQI